LRILYLAVVFMAAALLMVGCAAVQPWEKEKLGYSVMRFVTDDESAQYGQHMLNSREASSGGYGGAGGGCGCK
jgi:hypothetical protein